MKQFENAKEELARELEVDERRIDAHENLQGCPESLPFVQACGKGVAPSCSMGLDRPLVDRRRSDLYASMDRWRGSPV